MIAILSDIHGNLEALKAVLDDIREHEVEKTVCLGDVVGYGPNPAECLDLAAGFDWCIMGNHEEGLLSEAGCRNFTPRARAAIEWTREKLQAEGDEGQRRLEFIKQMETTHREGGVLFVHGSPLRPTRDYIFPRDAVSRKKLGAVFAKIQKLCFVGHTHLPGVFTENFRFAPPDEFMNVYMLDEKKAMVNVGSVGQPRDGDNRASYVTFDEDAIVFRRVAYDYKATMRRIRSIEKLHNTLAERLGKGA